VLSEPRRPLAVVRDVGPPLAAALAGVFEVLVADIGPQPAAVVLAALAPLPLVLRRRAPIVSGLVSLAVITSIGLFGVDISRPAVPLAVALLACFGFGARAPLPRGLLAVLGAMLLIYVQGGTLSDDAAPDLLFGGILVFAGFGAGRLVRLRSQALETVARGAEAQAQAARTAAVASERARIARELHDLIAHSLSVMVVQAAAAEQVLDADAGRARRALQAVQHTGRTALEETRTLLDLLREGEDASSPQPGLRDLADLAVRFPELDISVRMDDDLAGDLPAGAEVSIYRVVQEALTNVLKHSTNRRATVQLLRTPDGVVVQVDDGGPPRIESTLPGGHGLVGMKERVALYGGRLSAGAVDDGGFRVTASFPGRRTP
jgi:signal transduction histidine kinase